MQEQTARYEGATRDQATEQFRGHRPSAAKEGWPPIREDWFEEEGRAVLMVTYAYQAPAAAIATTPWQTTSGGAVQTSAVIY